MEQPYALYDESEGLMLIGVIRSKDLADVAVEVNRRLGYVIIPKPISHDAYAILKGLPGQGLTEDFSQIKLTQAEIYKLR